MAEYAKDISARFDVLKRKNADRDKRMRDILAVRSGHADLVFDGLFPTEWPKPIVANFIDVVATDTAEMVGVMPTITAAGDSILDESKRSRADRLTKIANYYPYASRFGSRLLTGADRFNTYGFLPLRIEANYDDMRPHIHVDDPMGAYVDFDRWGNVIAYGKRWNKKVSDLAALFPEYADKLDPYKTRRSSEATIEVVKWWDKDRCVLFVPERDAIVLAAYENPIKRVPVAVAVRPSLDDQMRGAFDDVLWVFAAKVKLAMLSMEAVQKAVEAPIALPADVQEMAFGPDSIIRSQNPQQIRRVPLELPQSALIEGRVLDEELRLGTRFPEARAGNMDASIVTGRGVQALMGGFDARIKSAQAVLGEAVADAISMCLEMDEALWPDQTRTVSSAHNGTPYELKYTPARDIKGNYNVSYEYGIMAGLDPNRALVWSLQALGAGLTSKSFVRRNLPVSMNVAEEEKVIDVERLRDALLASVQGYAQAIPGMAAQGQDPTQVVEVMASLVEARKKGVPIEEAVKSAFAPPPPPDPAESPEPMAPEMGAAPDAMAPSGAPDLGAGPQAPPAMQQLLAGLTESGRPQMASRVVRQIPAAQ